MRYLLSIASHPTSSPPTRGGSMLLSSCALFCWPHWIEPCSYPASSRPPGPFSRRTFSRGSQPLTPLQEKEDETPRSILKTTRRREEALLPPFLNSTSYWLWKMFSWEDHKAGRASGLLPAPTSFCVLFQAHPQLKFALKVSNFHFFSKQLHSSGIQISFLCAEEWVSLNKYIPEMSIQPGGQR